MTHLLSRRTILRGLLAAPIVCTPGLLMPVKQPLELLGVYDGQALYGGPVSSSMLSRNALYELLRPGLNEVFVREARDVAEWREVFA